MNRYLAVLCMIALASGLFWFYPLFHLVRTNDPNASKKQPRFDASNFADRYWKEQLLPALDDAVDASTVLAAIHESPQRTRRYIGRKVGMSRSRLYLLQGRGRVISVQKDGVGVSLDGDADKPDVVLQTTFLFGNVVRDATGLLNAGDFAHSQDFNDISTQLNRIVEDRVIAKLKKEAKVGQHMRFVGCVEISESASAPQPLPLIPLKVDSE